VGSGQSQLTENALRDAGCELRATKGINLQMLKQVQHDLKLGI